MRHVCILLLAAALSSLSYAASRFTFAIIGDRTGEAQPGVYEEVWREVDRAGISFAINVGDMIQGGDDRTAAQQWARLKPPLTHSKPFFLVPGNHDIWSPASEQVWRQVVKRPPYYGVTVQGVHFTVLDNSRTEDLSPDQMKFLEADLSRHSAIPLKFVVFHKPSWLLSVLFGNGDFALHRLAKQYGVSAILSGHVHRFGYWEVDGIAYLLVGSSGGHLRASGFSGGWFFHWIEAQVQGNRVDFVVHELPPPYGQGRLFPASQWPRISPP